MKNVKKLLIFLIAGAFLCNNTQAMEKKENPDISIEQNINYKDILGFNDNKTIAHITRYMDSGNRRISVHKNLKTTKYSSRGTILILSMTSNKTAYVDHRRFIPKERIVNALIYKLESFLKKQNVSGEKHSDKNELMVKSKVLEKIKDKELQKQLKDELNKLHNIIKNKPIKVNFIDGILCNGGKNNKGQLLKSFLEDKMKNHEIYGGQLQITTFGSKSPDEEHCFTGKTTFFLDNDIF
jgi:hypothetical protein